MLKHDQPEIILRKLQKIKTVMSISLNAILCLIERPFWLVYLAPNPIDTTIQKRTYCLKDFHGLKKINYKFD